MQDTVSGETGLQNAEARLVHVAVAIGDRSLSSPLAEVPSASQTGRVDPMNWRLTIRLVSKQGRGRQVKCLLAAPRYLRGTEVRPFGLIRTLG
jgi:hypothetical protein